MINNWLLPIFILHVPDLTETTLLVSFAIDYLSPDRAVPIRLETCAIYISSSSSSQYIVTFA